MPWFSTKAQIFQTVFTFGALVLSAVKAFPDMMSNNYLSGGAILFYLVSLLVVGSVWSLIVVLRKNRVDRTVAPADNPLQHERDHWMRAANEREGRLNACATQLEKVEADARAYQSEVVRLVDERGKQRSVQAELRRIKLGARRLREAGERVDFTMRPFNRDLWMNDPRVDQSWLRNAVGWHESAVSSPLLKRNDAALLRSLDFDEAMAELDEYEARTLGISPAFESASGEAPMVGISSLVMRDQNYGALVHNYGGSTALDITFYPCLIGDYKFQFDAIAMLPNGGDKVFVRSHVTDQTNGGLWVELTLSSVLSKDAQKRGGKPFPCSILLTYRDRHGHSFLTRHEVAIENGNEMVYIRRIEAR